MLLDLLILALGLGALFAGGEARVRGASGIALRLGVAPIMVGLTVVAFGTSTPELVVSVAAALRGTSAIGFGNVVGSNSANIGLLLGLTAAITPLAIHRTLVAREIPMMILACAAALVLGIGVGLEGELPGYGRSDGVMLLLLFTVFLYYTIGEGLRQRRDQVEDAAGEETEGRVEKGSTAPFLLVAGGLAALIVGGELTVRGAVEVARALDVSEAVIGLTLVAVGTSLPELATMLSAARRGQGDIAIGTVVGSNIFNMLFIWGTAVTIAPSVLPPNGTADLLVMTGFSLALLPMARTQHRVGRIEGLLLLIAYVGYVGWLAVR